MQAFTAEKTELLATYGADANRGLTEAQAQKNKEQYGANALTRRKPDSLLKRLWDAATEPMLLMLIAAGLIALAVNIVRQVTGGEADFLECVGVFVAIDLSVVISVVMEGRSAKAFEALSKDQRRYGGARRTRRPNGNAAKCRFGGGRCGAALCRR